MNAGHDVLLERSTRENGLWQQFCQLAMAAGGFENLNALMKGDMILVPTVPGDEKIRSASEDVRSKGSVLAFFSTRKGLTVDEKFAELFIDPNQEVTPEFYVKGMMALKSWRGVRNGTAFSRKKVVEFDSVAFMAMLLVLIRDQWAGYPGDLDTNGEASWFYVADRNMERVHVISIRREQESSQWRIDIVTSKQVDESFVPSFCIL